MEPIQGAAAITNEHEVRKQKLDLLRSQGVEPWPSHKEVTATCKQVHDTYTPEQEHKQVAVAGRIMTTRWHGKTAFFTIQDASGRLQVYIKKEIVGDELFDRIQHLIDSGDIVWFSGTPFLTKTQEVTLKVEQAVLLSKSLHPLPEKFHGIADVETKYRQRYLDLITSPESKDRFIARTMILRSIRRYLDEHGFLEVETPMLHPIAGGANARPFITHHNALTSDFYLRIAPELYLKRLVVGGFERVYEINRNFRNEGVSTRHNPEFTMLELYLAHHDYQYMMDFSEAMIKHVIDTACGTRNVTFGDHQIDFNKPFGRMTIVDAVKHYAQISEADLASDKIDATLKKHNIKAAHAQATVIEKIYALFEELVESKLIQPTFIIDHPIEISPLAKRSATNPSVAARFELYIAGMEIANAFNELNDPIDQAERFKAQLEQHKAGNDEAHQYDADYILALEYGLPPTVGYGMGIDRLVMIATNTTSIKEVILFPTLKRKHE
jgi:lysyl-tRNA synthetase class 2